jgi:hypothetical protein
MRKHTGENPFNCNICGRTYYERANYKYHLKTGHVPMPRDERKCKHPNCMQTFKSHKIKLVHHRKFEKECEHDKIILIDLIGKFQKTAEGLIRMFKIKEDSLKNSVEYQSLNEQFEETAKIVQNKELFYAVTNKIQLGN